MTALDGVTIRWRHKSSGADPHEQLQVRVVSCGPTACGEARTRAPLCTARVQLIGLIVVLLRLVAVLLGGQVPQAAHVAGPGRRPTAGGAVGGGEAPEGAEARCASGGAGRSRKRRGALGLCARWGGCAGRSSHCLRLPYRASTVKHAN